MDEVPYDNNFQGVEFAEGKAGQESLAALEEGGVAQAMVEGCLRQVTSISISERFFCLRYFQLDSTGMLRVFEDGAATRAKEAAAIVYEFDKKCKAKGSHDVGPKKKEQRVANFEVNGVEWFLFTLISLEEAVSCSKQHVDGEEQLTITLLDGEVLTLLDLATTADGSISDWYKAVAKTVTPVAIAPLTSGSDKAADHELISGDGNIFTLQVLSMDGSATSISVLPRHTILHVQRLYQQKTGASLAVDLWPADGADRLPQSSILEQCVSNGDTLYAVQGEVDNKILQDLSVSGRQV
jgi:hypothetical protein